MVGPIIIEANEVRFGDLTLHFHLRTDDGELRFVGLTGRADCGGFTVTSRSAIAANGEQRADVQLFARIEAGGDRIALSGSAAASRPVWAFAVTIGGVPGDEILTPSDPDLVAPAARLVDGSLTASYPTDISTPFAAVRCADGRFFVARCANLRVRPRRFTLRRSGDTAELVVEEAQRGVDTGPRLMLANWNLGWFDDVETPVATQRDAVSRLFKVTPFAERTDIPAWVPSLRVAIHCAFDARAGASLSFAEAGAAIERLAGLDDFSGVLVTTSGWSEPPGGSPTHWTPATRLGGLTGLVELRERCHAVSARLALWVDPTEVANPTEPGIALLSSGEPGFRADAAIPPRRNPGYELVRQNVRDVIERLVAEVRPDAVALRTTPAYLSTKEADYAEGLVALLRELRQSRPDLGWFVERPRDYLASDATLAFVTEPTVAPGLAPLRSFGIPLVEIPPEAERAPAPSADGSIVPGLTLREKSDETRIAPRLAVLLGRR